MSSLLSKGRRYGSCEGWARLVLELHLPMSAVLLLWSWVSEGTQSLHFILKISCSSHDLPLPHTVYFYSATFHHLFINLAVCVIPCVMLHLHHFQTILQKSLLGEMCPLYLTRATYLRAVGARSAGTNCRLKLCSSKGRWLIDAIHLKVSILSSWCKLNMKNIFITEAMH